MTIVPTIPFHDQLISDANLIRRELDRFRNNVHGLRLFCDPLSIESLAAVLMALGGIEDSAKECRQRLLLMANLPEDESTP